MSDNVIAIEKGNGPFQASLKKVMKLVPERDRLDEKLKRLIAFRLKIDGESPTVEYLTLKIREAVQCGYAGSLYDFLKNDLAEKECPPDSPDVA